MQTGLLQQGSMCQIWHSAIIFRYYLPIKKHFLTYHFHCLSSASVLSFTQIYVYILSQTLFISSQILVFLDMLIGVRGIVLKAQQLWTER